MEGREEAGVASTAGDVGSSPDAAEAPAWCCCTLVARDGVECGENGGGGVG